MLWQILTPILSAIVGAVAGGFTSFVLLKFFPNIQNVTYEGKILKLIKNNNLIRFVNYDILQLKDISLKKIEDYISTNGVSRKDDFKDLKNIILKLFIYLK